MTVVKWETPGTESSNLVTTQLDSLADGSTSAPFTLDNSADRDLYKKVRIVLGTLSPGAEAYLVFRVFGPNADVGGQALFAQNVPLLTGSAIKTSEFVFTCPPFAVECTIENQSGTSFASSGNGVFAQGFNEEGL